MESTNETEWWWIDYLEDEFDPALEKDLELLLEHSQEDRDAFENFRMLKQWIRECDPAGEGPPPESLVRLRSKIHGALAASVEVADVADVEPPETNSLSF